MNRFRLTLVSALFAAAAIRGNAQTSLNINCGGNDYTAIDRTQWVGDYYFNGGDLLYTSDAIVNSQDMPLYRSGRAGLYGDFSYNIPVANGNYNVTLHFAEIQYWNKGDRVFNVLINGTTALSNFDILANAAPRAAITRQFPVTVTNGIVQIAVNGVVKRGLLNGIQIAPATVAQAPPAPSAALALSTSALSFSATAGGANPAAQTISISNSGGGTLNWAAASSASWLVVSPASGTNSGTLSVQANLAGLSAGTQTGTITVDGGGAGAKTVAVTLTVAAAAPPPPPATLSSININCGGSDYTSLNNTKWIADYYFTGGDLLYTSDAVTNSQDLPLYRSARAGLYGDFSYSIPVVNGAYTVTLHFNEIQYWNKGDRVFNVAINGVTVLNNFDILGVVPPRTAMVQQFPVTATAGKIQIDITGVVRKGLLSGIQIADAGANPIAPPALTLSSSAMTFSATQGGANPAPQSVNISNGGSGSLTWTAATDAAWLGVSPASGSGNGAIAVQTATGSLAAGTYTGHVTVAAAGATASPKAITVTFTVAPPPPAVMTLSTAALSFSATAGSTNPAAQTVAVSNTGAGTMNWSASSNAAWLTVSPASGSNSGTIAAGVNAAGLAAGTYTAAITVSSTGATGSPKMVAVTLTLAAPPPAALTVSSPSLSFSGTANGSNPASQTVTVGNSGSGTMPWTATSNQAWLAVSPASGSNSGTLAISANISGLSAGTQAGTITISAGAAGTQTIAVSLTLAAAPAVTLAAAPNAVTLNATTGSNPGATNIALTCSGSPAWTAAKTKPWLTLSQSSGTGAATISVGAAAANMPAGAYTDIITVTSNSTNSPATVNVTLIVADAQQTPTLPSNGNNWFVSPSGGAGGDGSINHPWDIVTALAQPAAVRPGDTIWLRGGKYGDGQYNSQISSSLVGTPSLPIIVRAYPKERAIIDAWLLVGCCDGSPNPGAGSYTWFWGLELASYNANRTSGTSGPPEWAFQYNHQATDVWGAGTKFINCIVHDTAGGLSVWNAAGTELSGNIVFNVGGYGSDRGHGHSFYLQNAAPSILSVHDNIAFNNFDMGLQAYGSSDAWVQNIQLRGNTVFNSGVLYGQLVDNLTLGGGNGGPSGMVVDSNYFYDTPTLDQGYNEMGFLWTARSNDAVVTNNYFIGGKQAIDLERWDRLTFRNNTIYANSGEETMLILRDDQTAANYDHANNQYFGSGRFQIYSGCDYWPCTTNPVTANFATWMLLTGLDKGSTFQPGAPTGAWIAVRPNAYEAGRANVTVYNWDLKPSVQVDLSNAGIKIGDTYQIRDAENWFNGPVAQGTYTGSPVAIPMTNLAVVQPFGNVPYPPSHTAPQFGVFVVLSGNALNVY